MKKYFLILFVFLSHISKAQTDWMRYYKDKQRTKLAYIDTIKSPLIFTLNSAYKYVVWDSVSKKFYQTNTPSGGGGGTPGGSNGYVQYNGSGSFAGSANFFWDNTNARVGIGTASPAVDFDITKSAGSVVSQVKNTLASGESAIVVRNDVGYAAFELFGSSFGTGLSNMALFSTDANQTAGFAVATLANAPISFRTNSSGTSNERMIINGTGQVGIGTNSFLSAEKLRVNGATYIDGSVGINSTGIPNSAAFEVSSTDHGFLPPRMTTTQRNAIASPAEGLCVFDTDLNLIYVFDGSSWVGLSSGGGGGTTTNALSIAAELHSGGATSFDGSAAISLAIQAGSVTNSMLAGSISLSKLSITGTPDGTKYLRDDGSWQVVSGGSGVADPGGNGIMARTALNTSVNRTITGTTNEITVVDGDGVAGNPTISLPAIIDVTTKALSTQDNNFVIQDNTVTTKKLQFELSGITAENTRIVTWPDANITVARSDAPQTFTGAQTFTTAPVFSSITNTGTLTLPTVTGTFVQKTTASITTNATWSPQGDGSVNFYNITAQGGAVTAISAPSGTPTDGNELYIRVVDNGTARGIAGWNAIYSAGTNLAFPTTTTLGKYMIIKFIYNTMNGINKWQLCSVLDGL